METVVFLLDKLLILYGNGHFVSHFACSIRNWLQVVRMFDNFWNWPVEFSVLLPVIQT